MKPVSEEVVVLNPHDWIRKPFIRCPACTRPSYGVLTIAGNHYTRRCRDCRHTGSTLLPTLQKKVVYVDQMGLSQMLKAMDPRKPSHDKVNAQPHWRQMFQKLVRLVQLQLIVCPDSCFHEEETSLWEHGDDLRELGRLLSGGVHFHDKDYLLHTQLVGHAEAWAKGESWSLNARPEDAVPGELNKWLDWITVSVDFHWE